MRGLYEAAGLKAPPDARGAFTASPITAAIAAGAASGVWWLREHPERHEELFGRKLEERDIVAGIVPACSVATRSGLEMLYYGEVSRLGKVTGVPCVDDSAAAALSAVEATHQAIFRDAGDITPLASSDETTIARVAHFMLGCISKSWSFRNGGNQWSAWVAYLSFFRHVAKLDLAVYDKFQHYEVLAEISGPRYVHERFWIISDFPERIERDEENRAHCATGPQITWRDGWASWSHHSTGVPGRWIEERDTLKPTVALTWPNIEQRRAAAEIIGWEKVLRELSPRVVDQDRDPQIGVLLECDLPDAGRARFLKVLCGTGRTFVLPVPVEVETAREANAWTYGIEPGQLRLEART